MKNSSINFDREVSYRGRNGNGRQTGIEIFIHTKNGDEDYISINPINSRGPSDAASIEIPIENVAALMNALSRLAGIEDEYTDSEDENSEAVMKALNMDAREISVPTLAFIQTTEPEYKDTRLKEDLYSLETMLEDNDDFEQQPQAVQDEIHKLHKMLADKDAGYLRIIY